MTERSLTRSSKVEYAEPTELEFFRGNALAGGGAGDGQGLWKLLSDRLTGRWKFAVPLAFVLAAIFSTAGYFVTEATYQSTGVIRVVPNIVPIMRHTAETGLMPLYSNYIRTQASLVTGSRVLERAVQNLDLSRLPWDDRQSALRALQRVSARAEVNSELILVQFSAESPEVAQAVVNAVIQAYDELYGSVDGDQVTRRLQTLRTYRGTLRAQQRQVRTQLEDAVANSEYGVADYASLISEKASYIHQAELELRRLNVMLAVASAQAPADGAIGDEPLYARQIEAMDEELARLRRLSDDARLRLALARERQTAEHPARIAAEKHLGVIERLYNDRLDVVRQTLIDGGQLEFADPVSKLEMQIARLREEMEQERQAVRRLTQTQQDLNNTRAELKDIEQELADTSSRLRELEVESDAVRSGRIVIASMGDQPVSPSRDRRRQLAVLGAIAGFGAGVGLFFLLGTIDRRAFAVDQLSSSAAVGRVLGVLPALPKGTHDLDAAGVAAHCVHQIRNKIEAVRRPGGSIVLAVSSPGPGDGKTSLATSLAASYATAGLQTLLVDCDMAGRNLTRQTQQSGSTGLREALASGALNGCIRDMPFKHLSILPCGGGDVEFGPEMVRKEDLVALFSQLRPKYEVVIVDTGPVHGSIESLPVASAVDGVILAMRRGGRQSLLENCVESLKSVGATYLGMVLNFAHSSDCERYASRSKVSGQDIRPNGSSVSQDSEGGLTQNVLMRAMNGSGQRAAPEREES